MQNYLNNRLYTALKDRNSNYDKRWKALHALYKQLEEESQQHLQFFLNSHPLDVFDVVFYYLTKYKVGALSFIQWTYLELPESIKVLVQLIKAIAKEKWQLFFDSISHKLLLLLYKGLNYQNKKSIRVFSIEIILNCIDKFPSNLIGTPKVRPLIQLLSASIDVKCIQTGASSLFQERCIYTEERSMFMQQDLSSEWCRQMQETTQAVSHEQSLLKELLAMISQMFSHHSKWMFIVDKIWGSVAFGQAVFDLSLQNQGKELISVQVIGALDEDTELLLQTRVLTYINTSLQIMSHSQIKEEKLSLEEYLKLLNLFKTIFAQSEHQRISIDLLKTITQFLSVIGVTYQLPLCVENEDQLFIVQIKTFERISDSVISEIRFEKPFWETVLKRITYYNSVTKALITHFLCSEQGEKMQNVEAIMLDFLNQVLQNRSKLNFEGQLNLDIVESLKNMLKITKYYNYDLTHQNKLWKQVLAICASFMNDSTIFSSIGGFLCEQTQSLLFSMYQTSSFEIYSWPDARIEQLMQVLVQDHHKRCNLSCIQLPTERYLSLDYTEDGTTIEKKQQLMNLSNQFTFWIHLFTLCTKTSLYTTPECYLNCGKMANLVFKVIEDFQDYNQTSKKKPNTIKVYYPPTQTLMQIYHCCFHEVLGYPYQETQTQMVLQQKPLESEEDFMLLKSKSYLVKTFCQIIVNTQSNMELSATIIYDFLSLTNRITSASTCFKGPLIYEADFLSLILFIESAEIFTLQVPGSQYLIKFYYETIQKMLDLKFLGSLNPQILNMISRIIMIEVPPLDSVNDEDWLQPRDTITSPILVKESISNYQNESETRLILSALKLCQNLISICQLAPDQSPPRMKISFEKIRDNLISTLINFTDQLTQLIDENSLNSLINDEVLATLKCVILPLALGNQGTNRTREFLEFVVRVIEYGYLQKKNISAKYLSLLSVILETSFMPLGSDTAENLFSQLCSLIQRCDEKTPFAVSLIYCLQHLIINEKILDSKQSLQNTTTLKNIIEHLNGIISLRSQVSLLKDYLLKYYYDYPPLGQTPELNTSVFNSDALKNHSQISQMFSNEQQQDPVELQKNIDKLLGIHQDFVPIVSLAPKPPKTLNDVNLLLVNEGYRKRKFEGRLLVQGPNIIEHIRNPGKYLMIMRSPFSNYAWEFRHYQRIKEAMIYHHLNQSTNSLAQSDMGPIFASQNRDGEQRMFSFAYNQPAPPQENVLPLSILFDMICKTIEKIPEVLVTNKPKNSKILQKSEQDRQFDQDINTCEQQLRSIKRSSSLVLKHLSLYQKDSIQDYNALDHQRLFLASLGLINKQNPAELYLLEQEKEKEQLCSKISIIDQNTSRETLKVGVIYVGQDQDDQREIFANTRGSPKYEQFIRSLGQTIELSDHLGYDAGLTDGKDGQQTVYFSNMDIELAYHISTFMPTNMQDEQHINKKRHIGNDNVLLVWSENSRDYKKHTITSSFNFIQVIVYPLKNDVYRLAILEKDAEKTLFSYKEVNSFLVSAEELPKIVTILCLEANRCKSLAALLKNDDDSRFNKYFDRCHRLSETISKFQTADQGSSRLLSCLLSSQ